MAMISDQLEAHRGRLVVIINHRITDAVRGRFDAEDVVQDALKEAFQRWGDEPPEGDPDRSSPNPARESPHDEPLPVGRSIPFSWLYRLAMQKYIDRVRTAFAGIRDVQLEVPVPDASVLALRTEFRTSTPGPLTQLQQQEMSDVIRKAVALLKPRDRELIWMRVVDQLTFVEIGEYLDLSENSATVAFARALRKLREMCRQLSCDFDSVAY